MGTQVIRLETYKKSDLGGIGREQLRGPQTRCKNSEIDSSRTHLNRELIPAGGTMEKAWERCMRDMNAKPFNRQGNGAFQQMIITSGQEWFAERFGWDPEHPVLTEELLRWAQESVDWAVAQIGYHGTAVNIMAATLHLDETTPHIHISFLPATDIQRKKILQKDADGKVMRNENGSALAKRDPETGHTVYVHVEHTRPRLAKSDFWALYGGEKSEDATGIPKIGYRLLQDSYHEQVGKAWGLGRGERGSGRWHKTIYQHQVEQKQRHLNRLDKISTQSVKTARDAQRQTQIAKDAQIKAEAAAEAAKKEELSTRKLVESRKCEARARADHILSVAEQQAARLREDADLEIQERTAVMDQREGSLVTREESLGEEARLLRERNLAQDLRELEWQENRDQRIREFTAEAGGVQQQVMAMTVAVDLGTNLKELGHPGLFGRWTYTEKERQELISAAVEGQARIAAAQSANALREELQKAEQALTEEKKASAAYQTEIRSWKEKAHKQEVEITGLRPLANEAGHLRGEMDRLQSVQKGLHSLVCGLLGLVEDTRKYWEQTPVLANVFRHVQKWLTERASRLQLDSRSLQPTPEAAPDSLLSHIRMWQQAEQEKKKREQQAARAEQTRQRDRSRKRPPQKGWER